MDSKKFSFFAFFMVMVMCVFSIYMGVTSKGEKGVNGKNGLSSYELAIKNGVISSDMTEVQYLQSLYGKDGSSVTLESVYEAYLKESGNTKDELTYTEFILTYYPEKIVSDSQSVSMVENATQQALRTTVDICYSYLMDTPIIEGYYATLTDDTEVFVIESSDKYVSVGVSAGSGIIYRYEDVDSDGEYDVAYIVTNYHVVYCDDYSNDSLYNIYCDTKGDKNSANDEYFSGTFDETQTFNVSSYGWSSKTYKCIEASNISFAPIYTHFLKDYGIYLYGHQSKEYRISASFVGGSADNDIAVLKVVRDGNANNNLIFSKSYTSVTLGESSNLKEGQTIVAVGNPLLADTSSVDSSSASTYVESVENAYIDALCLTSTSGEVSNLSEECLFTSIIDSTKTNSMRLIRVSSAINAGNSGGGLYSADGKLVGIVNGKIESSSYDNIGYAIPIDKVKNIVNQIIYQCDNDNTFTTRMNAVKESSIGLYVKNGQSKSYYDSNSLAWNLSYDVEVSSVSGAALRADFEVGDIINSVTIGENEYAINFYYDLNDCLLTVNTQIESLIFNVTRIDENGEVKNFEIVFGLTRSSFVEII